VVVFDEPISLGTYGETPELDYISDEYRSQPRNEHRFEVVGYGLENSGPFVAEGGDTRCKGGAKLDSLNSVPPDTYILLSISNGKVHRARPALASAAFIA
jgi:hypothetical protein